MRVELRIEGGLGSFPGLGLPFTVDSDALGAEEARELAALVAGSGLLAATRRGRHAPAAAAKPDARRYTLTIDDEGRLRTLTLEDPLPPQLAPLVAFLKERQRDARR